MAFLLPSPGISSVSAQKCITNPKFLRNLSILARNEKILSSSRVTVSVKDCEIRVLGVDKNLKLYGQFSAPVKPEPKVSKEEEERQNYYLNMGYAIRTLREEFPDIFYKEPSFDIYRDDIVFKDPLNSFAGIENYKSIFWALRFNGSMFFKALSLDIVSVWQPVDNVIMVRFTVHGIPRVPWDSRSRFDGTSEYKLDKNGKIYEHKVDNMALSSPPKFHGLTVQELIQSIGCSSTPRPTYSEASRR